MTAKKTTQKAAKTSAGAKGFTAEERDTTMQHGVEEGAKSGFARVDELLQRLVETR